jgi:hypothetical protein
LEINHLIQDKVVHIQTIIRNTIISINHYKKYDIFSNSDVIICITSLVELYDKSNQILSQIVQFELPENIRSAAPPAEEEFKNPLGEMNQIIDTLQTIIDKISIIISGFGTKYMADLFFISFGSEFSEKMVANPIFREKYGLLLDYVRPIGCKTVHWKQSKTRPKEIGPTSTPCCNKMTEDTIHIETSNTYECFDVDNSIKSIYVKIYGIRIVIHNEKAQKTLIIHGIVDDMVVDCIANQYIDFRKQDILSGINDSVDSYIIRRMVDTMTLKDMLVWGKEDVYKKYTQIMMEVNGVKQNKLNVTISKFLELDICEQRQTLIYLLIYDKESEIQYITYLLYDLITANSSGTSVDSLEQMMIYESFPWKIKLFFKETMKNTIKYTKDVMQKYDINRITLEQQIYVMKAPESIKEKAMLKLKEIKGKPEDTGTKAKQYLEGLLRIPFGVYREEPILKKMKQINAQFIYCLSKSSVLFSSIPIAKKDKYTTIEILQYISQVEQYTKTKLIPAILSQISSLSTKQLMNVISLINGIYRVQNHKLIIAKSREDRLESIAVFLDECVEKSRNHADSLELLKYRDYVVQIYDLIYSATPDLSTSILRITNDLDKTKTSILDIKGDLSHVTQMLDESIYGHTHAKNQILKIIGQWMNGEQSGYCFGFEGSPGIGKTSLAKKGLSKCLTTQNGESRPFAFIALGGSCNGSTLEGHSYTDVNSTWGRIVDILMDTKCMNPIIYIDELDKVSKTEHGKEIIGILTHLIDTTQNDIFQDKYFSGIDLDLSKALFIFSYNDPQQIDRILLDRIHRIKFENLSLDEKIVIVKRYILPEINRKMGFMDAIVLTDEIIEYIIETYTLEPGIRKLKEIIFDLFGEINMEILKCADSTAISMPLVVTVEDLTNKYLSKYDKMNDKLIHKTPEMGVINGLWASIYGRGGIIPIQTMFYPTSSFLDLRLTGLQGDVMKESMNVAKSLAWNLLDLETKKAWMKTFEETKCQGLHIHCPEGAVSKDGPSAGAAITLAIYSLFTKRPIRNTVAITGEINLQGFITEIGGLDCKIAGGMKAGVTTFLYPEKNKEDYEKFMKKNKDKKNMDQIKFVSVSHISDTLEHVFDA